MRVLHLALAADWDAARRSGAYTTSTRGVTLAQEGFVHASTVSQVGRVAASFYSGAGPLVLLVLDVGALEEAGSPLRWEVPDGLDEAYPHVYGPLPVSAVVAAFPAGVDALEMPDLAGLDVVPEPPAR